MTEKTTDQRTDAAERSAHVTRGETLRTVTSPMVEIKPGVWKLRAVIEAEEARDQILSAWLRSIQAEKGCKTDGNPCHPETCVCALAQQLIFEDAKNEK